MALGTAGITRAQEIELPPIVVTGTFELRQGAAVTDLFTLHLQKQIETIPESAMKILSNWDWPGNIRELENFIERAVILTRGRSLEVPIAELNKARLDAPVDKLRANGQDDIARMVKEALSEMNNGGLRNAANEYDEKQRQEIIHFLSDTKGRVGGADGAAARMGVNRTTLLSRMKRHGIYAKQFF